MYNQPFMIPGYGISSVPLNTARVASAASAGGRGLFSRLGGLFGGLRGINWGGFINNASKTLGIINQSIPLVKQVGPMVGNMKSMLKVASVFKDETDAPRSRKGFRRNNNQQYNNQQYNQNMQNVNNNSNSYQNNTSINNQEELYNIDKGQDTEEKSVYNNYPTFFISHN